MLCLTSSSVFLNLNNKFKIMILLSNNIEDDHSMTSTRNSSFW